MATRNKTGEGIQPCRTPDLTGRLCPRILEDDNALEVLTKFPGDNNNLGWYSVCPIKVLLKTLVTVECLKVKLKNKGTFHSIHCSLMFRRAETLSLQPPPSEIQPVAASTLDLWHHQSLWGIICRRPFWEWTEVLCLASCHNCWGPLPSESCI